VLRKVKYAAKITDFAFCRKLLRNFNFFAKSFDRGGKEEICFLKNYEKTPDTVYAF
jgi:hypothetical protein